VVDLHLISLIYLLPFIISWLHMSHDKRLLGKAAGLHYTTAYFDSLQESVPHHLQIQAIYEFEGVVRVTESNMMHGLLQLCWSLAPFLLPLYTTNWLTQ